jgi:SAM-dependent methyltransferase
MRRSNWQTAAGELSDALSCGQITDEVWFSGMAAIFDAAYLAGDNPRAQSGFGGDESRWEAARRPIAEAIDRDGTFLDVGCANGYLMECVSRWAPHRVEAYGLELAPAVAGLARRRLPHWADRIFAGNALTWQSPMQFDFVRTELVYVPDEHQEPYLRRLLAEVVAPGGRLIVCGYGSPRSGVAADPVRRKVRSYGFDPELELLAEAPEGSGPIIEVAVLRAAVSGPDG